MNILIICGETSANIYGAHLAKTLVNSGHTVYSFGDAIIGAESKQLLSIDSTYHSASYGARHLKRDLINNMESILKMTNTQFDRAIIIDFPRYNFDIASLLQSFNISIYTYITPNFWIWNQLSNGKKLLRYSDKVITIFKGEYDFYASIDKEKVVYLGHPLSLSLLPNKYSDADQKTICIFPGSRRSEIRDHLPVMAKIIHQLRNHSSFKFSVVCQNKSLHSLINKILDRYKLDSIPIYNNHNFDIHYAISAPGTNTLRLALLGIPTTIIGQLKYLAYLIAKYVLRIKIKYIALPNMILDKPVLPEYVQVGSSTHIIAEEIIQILDSPSSIQEIQNELATITEKITAPSDYWDQIAAIVSE